MELIPILATIILMATISTFFLAIGAYVLYKIRERRGAKVEAIQPQTIQAELITPEALVEQYRQTVEQTQKAPVRQFERPNPPAYKPSVEPIFVQKQITQPITTPTPGSAPAPQRMVVGQQEIQKPGPAQFQPGPADQKFRKVTSEGYIAPKEEKKQGAVKWR
ncbi:MAG: hypothetical protein LWX56_12785 [Ignavibacteria bacterium]|nr:hypothetical protein [Ignavibacteria bacterium]